MEFEIEEERRFLVRIKSGDVFLVRPKNIRVGYFVSNDPNEELRIRIIDNKRAFLNSKIGKGKKRLEAKSVSMDLQLAECQLLRVCRYGLEKNRRVIDDGWELDIFEGSLRGLSILEYESSAKGNVADIPDFPRWVENPIEITNHMSGFELAKLAKYLEHLPHLDVYQAVLNWARPIPIIGLTGGPFSGKSTVLEGIQKRFGDKFTYGKEVATIAIDYGVGLADDRNLLHYLKGQEAVYNIQLSFLDALYARALHDKKSALLFDRGTMDNPPYFLGGIPQFESICHTSAIAEYRRYDLMFYLETLSEAVYLLKGKNNTARYEPGYKEIVETGRQTKESWNGHYKLVVIPSSYDEEQRLNYIIGKMEDFLASWQQKFAS